LAQIDMAEQTLGGATGSSPACVYRNGAGNYTISATSSNQVGSEFFLSGDTGGGATQTLKYSVTISDGAQANGVTMSSGATGVSGPAPADAASVTCGGAPNATIEVEVLSTDLNAVAPAAYSDTLTLVVAPE